MANTFDYSTEQVITITNNAVDVAIDDAGTQKNADGVKVIPAARFVQFYGKNLWTKLESGDTLTVTAKTAAEIAFYVAQANDEISVVVGEGETVEDTTTDEGDATE